MTVTKITEKGCKVTFTRNIAKITDSKGEVSAIAERIDNLYYISKKEESSNKICRKAHFKN